MKSVKYHLPVILLGLTTLMSCSDWDDHYDEKSISTDSSLIEMYSGDIVTYMKTTADVSQISKVFEDAGIYSSTSSDRQYTFIVCNNDIFSDGAVTDKSLFANYSVSDMAVAPSELSDGLGLYTRAGKNIWIYKEDDKFMFDEYNIAKTVKTANGYVYYIDGVMSIRPSVYEYLQTLGANYSMFKELVARNEEIIFDREHSNPIGVNNEGMTVYDSVKVIRNELMDRYTSEGVATWNMRDEQYITTMFIPTNSQISQAINDAMDSIPVWLGREATRADQEKFEQWIVKACFADQRLETSQVSSSAPDIACVGGYQKVIDNVSDLTTYKEMTPAYWRPSVQTVNTANKVNLSNGVAYFCTSLKIPNHIVIYRVKARLYQVWNAMTPAQREQHFRWNHWVDPLVIDECQSPFELSPQLPTMYYNELTAVPDSIAIADSLHCSVNYDGVIYNEQTRRLQECNLPAGEYYLRMGFKHSLLYSLSISFNDTLLVENMVMHAQGSNFHFDRGAASEVPHYGGDGISYGEGFDVDYWQKLDPKAIAYDTDGYTVGIVTLKEDGNFTITVDSYDNCYTYEATGRNKNNVTQLMMYHWCLRPTHNNY